MYVQAANAWTFVSSLITAESIGDTTACLKLHGMSKPLSSVCLCMQRWCQHVLSKLACCHDACHCRNIIFAGGTAVPVARLIDCLLVQDGLYMTKSS